MPDGSMRGGRPAFTDAPARKRKVLIADLFCGAGGSSTGAIKALKRLGLDPVLTCVNHWPLAIETHQKNHPEARHYCMDVESVKPEDVVPEGRLDLLMASPTCTYHSRARGGRPTSDQQRMDPWHVVRWLTSLRVKRLLVENVPEFVEWGPVDTRTGKPIKARRGEYFNAWLAALEAVGMRVDWRIINCADYGDATTRKRFILIGRSDGRRRAWGSPGVPPEVKIERGAFGLPWPVASHAPKAEAAARGLKPWRAAREIIDWDLEGQSIFTRARPLAPNTIRRIAAGIVKYGGAAAAGFLVVLRRHADARGLDLPLPTVTANGTHLGLARLTLEPFVLGQQSGATARSVDMPLPTISCGGAISVIEPFITPYYGSGSGCTGKSVAEPLDTITTLARFGLVEAVAQALGSIAADDPRIVMIDGRPYVFDILFRMLVNRELAAATGFSSAETAYEFVGNARQVTRQIGNAVPVHTSMAHVAALFAPGKEKGVRS